MFEDILNGVIGAIQSVFYWLLSTIFSIVEPLFDAILSGFPTLRNNLAVASEWLGYIEFFIPLTYGMELLSGYIIFRSAWLLITVPIKYLFPGLG